MLNNHDFNIDQNNRDYYFFHNQAALLHFIEKFKFLDNDLFKKKNVFSVYFFLLDRFPDKGT